MRIHLRFNNKNFDNQVSMTFESEDIFKSFIYNKIRNVLDLFDNEDKIEIYISNYKSNHSLSLGNNFSIEKKKAFEKFELWTFFNRYDCVEAKVERDELIEFAVGFIKNFIGEIGGESNEVERNIDSNSHVD